MVKDEQVRLLRSKMTQGKKQEAAAAAAGMSVRSARKWQTGPLPSQAKRKRVWRTRKDPFEEIWATKIEPLLKADTKGELEAKTLMRMLGPADPHSRARSMRTRVSDALAADVPPEITH